MLHIIIEAIKINHDSTTTEKFLKLGNVWEIAELRISLFLEDIVKLFSNGQKYRLKIIIERIN